MHASIVNTLVGLDNHSVDERSGRYYTYTHAADEITVIIVYCAHQLEITLPVTLRREFKVVERESLKFHSEA